MCANLYKGYIENKDENREAAELLLSCNDALFTEENNRIVLAAYAVCLMAQAQGLSSGNCFEDYLAGGLDFGKRNRLIEDLIKDRERIRKFPDALKKVIKMPLRYEPGKDFLGLIYISLTEKGGRKASGIYYTPVSVVKRLIDGLSGREFFAEGQFLDPCCGTGNFLLALLPLVKSMEQLHGQDIDEISILLTRINLALASPKCGTEFLYRNFVCRDTLLQQPKKRFHYIIGNPPWGSVFPPQQEALLRSRYKSAVLKKIEAYDLFVECALKMTRPGGVVAFVLPEAILNVRAHKAIRNVILKQAKIKSAAYLGNVFDRVQCPAVILELERVNKTDGIIENCRVEMRGNAFTIRMPRRPDAACFNLHVSDEEYRCLMRLEKTKGAKRLLGNAEFALGIVTGNNQKHISHTCRADEERLLRGTDIFRYGIKEAGCYIHFTPEKFQQVAPEALYRAPEKLFYRFICTSPVFAYDDQKTLSLNSCNILIPQIPGLSVKYVMAVLNSRAAAFYCKKKFHSLKVLRSHIEAIPIPQANLREQAEIIEQADRIAAGEDAAQAYERIDKRMMQLYGLSSKEEGIIMKALAGQALLLY